MASSTDSPALHRVPRLPALTRRARANAQLSDLLVQSVTEYAIVMLDPSGRIISWNTGAERTMGYGAEEIVGRHFSCFYVPEDVAAGYPEHDLRAALANEHHRVDRQHVRKDGSAYWAHVVLSPIRTEDGELTGFAKVSQDETLTLDHTFTAVERDARRSHRIADRRRQVVAQALGIAERQRQELAERLHDGPIQTLLSASQDLREVASGSGSGRASLERAAESVTRSIKQLRDATVELSPVAPIALRLDEAVRVLGDQAAARGRLTCRVRVDRTAIGVDDHAALAITRELLANVVKHAHAVNVLVDLQHGADGSLRITVADDGVGTRPARLREALVESHIGLALMAARVEERNGVLNVSGNEDGGTTVRVTLPAVPGP